jgi:hypothetical protein
MHEESVNSEAVAEGWSQNVQFEQVVFKKVIKHFEDILFWTRRLIRMTAMITPRDFLDKIEKTYGKAKRMWVMDRGIPSEEILREMREPAREIFYLVGTPKGKIRQYEKKLNLPW